MMWNGLSTPPRSSFSLSFRRDAPEVRRLIALSSRRGPGVNTERPEPEGRGRTVLTPGGGCYSTPVRTKVVVGQAIDDAPERSGSENRHDDVHVSKSQ